MTIFKSSEGTAMLIYIEPKSSFSLISSDTLYGALVNTLQILSEDFNDILLELMENPPFLISSAFPFVQDQKINHFYPKPLLPNNKSTSLNIDNIKKYKTVKYIHESVFSKIISGELEENRLIETIDNYYIESGLLYPKDLKLNFDIGLLDTSRNSLNRITYFSNLFFSSGYHYKNVGLFFIIRFLNTDFQNKYSELLKGCFRFLSDRGLGGDISVGKGHFDILDIRDEEIINDPSDGNRFVSLSNYMPTLEEVELFQKNDDLCYELYTKRGRDSRGRIRKKVRFFREGSTFPELNKNVYGKATYVDDKAVEIGYSFNVRMRELI